jgi:uncharacterized membrane protein YedE/YeeE
MNNEGPVAGFQFTLTGVDVDAVAGGSAEANGFMLSTAGGTVIGFSLTGDTIPPGNTTLVTLQVANGSEEMCLVDVILSDSVGNSIDVDVDDCCCGCINFIPANVGAGAPVMTSLKRFRI